MLGWLMDSSVDKGVHHKPAQQSSLNVHSRRKEPASDTRTHAHKELSQVSPWKILLSSQGLTQTLLSMYLVRFLVGNPHITEQ